MRAINQIGAVGRAHSTQHHCHVLCNCILADVQVLADLHVGEAPRDQFQYAHLASRQFHAETGRGIGRGWHLFWHR
jgi:hypothetical protein